MDMLDAANTAFVRFREGRLADAKRALADPVQFAREARDTVDDTDLLSEILALSIDVDLALGLTAAAEEAYAVLHFWEERIAAQFAATLFSPSRSRSFRFPRQAGRRFLAATGRFAMAIDSVEVEAASEDDQEEPLWEGTPARYRVELAVRAQRLQEIVVYGTRWSTERRLLPPSADGIRDEAEETMLLAAVEVAQAQLRAARRSAMRQARRLVLSGLARLEEEPDALVTIHGRLLLGQIARLRHDPLGSLLLEQGRDDAHAIGHRDLEGQFALELARVALARNDVRGARALASAAVDLARSQDGGCHIRATLDPAHALLLQADTRLARARARVNAKVAERRETIVLVHGTFAAPTPDERQWYERGSEFSAALDAALAALGSTAMCWAHLPDGEREFFWTGENRWIDRNEAAAALASYIDALSPRWRCHIVAHSHGGNVVHQALRLLKNAWDGRLVTLGTPFFHDSKPKSKPWGSGYNARSGTTLDEAIDGLAAEIMWPRALAISSDHDEALRILRLALEVKEPPGSHDSRSFLALARGAWAESVRAARARDSRLAVPLVSFVRTLAQVAATPWLLRRAWNAGRDSLTGMAGFGVDAGRLQVRPEVAVYGKRANAKYSPLPEAVVLVAQKERQEDVSRSYEATQAFLDSERWTLASVDQLLKRVSAGKLVHSAYYKDPRCIKVIARWLSVPEPKGPRDPFAELHAREISHPLGVPQQDLWSDETD